MGANAIFLAPNDTQIARGETPADSAKVLSEYVDGIIVRTYAHARVEEIAANASIPVINGLTDLHHPCQALADFLTMREHYGTLENLKLAYLGDGNNVLHSLLIVGALIGVDISAACPKGYWPDSKILEQAQIRRENLTRKSTLPRTWKRHALEPTPFIRTCGLPWARKRRTSVARKTWPHIR